LNSVDEASPGPDDRQQVSGIEPAPSLLGHLQQLEGHGQRLLPFARPLSHPLPQPDGGEGGLDDIGGPQVLPVFGREVVQVKQRLLVFGQALDRPLLPR